MAAPQLAYVRIWGCHHRLHSTPFRDRNESIAGTNRKPLLNMKSKLLVLSVLVFGPLAASGQVAPGPNQRVNSPAPGVANLPTGAEYAAVSVAPRAGGANNQGNFRGAFGQQGRRGAEYVAVTVAPRR